MIDLSFSEMLLVAVIAIVVIGPKDLPRVMSQVGRWVGQGKAMVRQLRHGFDEMVRETELAEMEKRWAEHNQRIMAEHPEAVEDGTKADGAQADNPNAADIEAQPAMQPLPTPKAAADTPPTATSETDTAPELPLDPPKDGAP